MNISIKIKTELGEFQEDMVVTEDQYKKIKEMSSTFFEGGYELNTSDGFVVIPPDVTRRSILIIENK